MGFKSKKFLKTGIGITVGSIGLGVGAQVASGIPGANVAGIANLSGALPTIGTIAAASFTLDALGGLRDTTKKMKGRK